MIPQYDNEVLSSFILWFDHHLLDKGQAYRNITQSFTQENNSAIQTSGLTYYKAPQTQWVIDSSIVGANIPSGVTVNGSFVNRGTNGLLIDFENGGCFYNQTGRSISASYAVKDFNIYKATQYESMLYIERALNGENVFFDQKPGAQNRFIGPCALISLDPNENRPFALGGTDMTSSKIEVAMISNNEDILGAALSIFRDTNQGCFPLVKFEDVPYTRFGDIKSGEYNYIDLDNKYHGQDRRIFIDRVRVNPVRGFKDKNSFYAGYLVFDIQDIRNPRL